MEPDFLVGLEAEEVEVEVGAAEEAVAGVAGVCRSVQVCVRRVSLHSGVQSTARRQLTMLVHLLCPAYSDRQVAHTVQGNTRIHNRRMRQESKLRVEGAGTNWCLK